MGSTNFEIIDAQALLNQLGELEQIRQNIDRSKEEINTCKTRIANAWESDTEDKESYLGNLSATLNKLNILSTSIANLTVILRNFAENAIRQGNNN